MKVRRIVEIETNTFEVGDQIRLGKYTATAMKQDGDCMIFCFDQYLDKPYNHVNLLERINKDILSEHDIVVALRDVFVTPFPEDIIFRIPYAGEIFMGTSEEEWVREYIEPDNDGGFYEGWPSMKDRKNRIASRKNEYEWGWLMNKVKNSAASFAIVYSSGTADYYNASDTYVGVRPVFQVRNK